mmetsp:Transcript_12795/g.34433  ORF Transcript_12795/g.34433 Transcript_12795/m.34433 type:complete len:1349 (+) Transcript_12795:310-4356(+)
MSRKQALKGKQRSAFNHVTKDAELARFIAFTDTSKQLAGALHGGMSSRAVLNAGEKPPEDAFVLGKLEGRIFELAPGVEPDARTPVSSGFSLNICKEEVVLGRSTHPPRPNDGEPAVYAHQVRPQASDVDFGIGTSNKISRKQVRLRYRPELLTFSVETIGKNDLLVHGAVGFENSTQLLSSDDKPLLLQNGTVLLVGDCMMTFFEPVVTEDSQVERKRKKGGRERDNEAQGAVVGVKRENAATLPRQSRIEGGDKNVEEFAGISTDTPRGWLAKDIQVLRQAVLKFGFGRWTVIRADSASSRLESKPEHELIVVARQLLSKCLVATKITQEKKVLEALLREDLPPTLNESAVNNQLKKDYAAAERDFRTTERRKCVRWIRRLRLLKRVRDIVHRELLDQLRSGSVHVQAEPPAPWWNSQCDADLVLGIYKHGFGEFERIVADVDLGFRKMCSHIMLRNAGAASGLKDETYGASQNKKSNASMNDGDGDEDDDEDGDDDDAAEEPEVDGVGSANLQPRGSQSPQQTNEVAAAPTEHARLSADAHPKPEADQEQPEADREQPRAASAGEAAQEVHQGSLAFPSSDLVQRRLKSVVFSCAKELERLERTEQQKKAALVKQRAKEILKKNVQKEKAKEKETQRMGKIVARSQPFSRKEVLEFERALLNIGVNYINQQPNVRDWDWFSKKTDGIFQLKTPETLELAYETLMTECSRAVEERDRVEPQEDLDSVHRGHAGGSNNDPDIELADTYDRGVEDAKSKSESDRLTRSIDPTQQKSDDASVTTEDRKAKENGIQASGTLSPAKKCLAKDESGSAAVSAGGNEGGHPTGEASVTIVEKSLEIGKTERAFQMSGERADRLLERLEFFRYLRLEVLGHPMLAQILKGCRRAKELPAWWKGIHDRMLLVGIDVHGFGTAEAIFHDPALGFVTAAQSYAKKIPATSANEKKCAFPKIIALIRRANFLLSYFRVRVNDPHFRRSVDGREMNDSELQRDVDGAEGSTEAIAEAVTKSENSSDELLRLYQQAMRGESNGIATPKAAVDDIVRKANLDAKHIGGDPELSKKLRDALNQVSVAHAELVEGQKKLAARLATDSRKFILDLPLDDSGMPQTPVLLEPDLAVLAFGKIDHERLAFHTAHVIFPIGFCSVRTMTDDVLFVCEIMDIDMYRSRFPAGVAASAAESERCDAPIFVISRSTHRKLLTEPLSSTHRVQELCDFVACSNDATAAWYLAANRAGVSASSLPAHDFGADAERIAHLFSGAERFGLLDPTVVHFIQRLEGASRCAFYRPRDVDVAREPEELNISVTKNVWPDSASPSFLHSAAREDMTLPASWIAQYAGPMRKRRRTYWT